MERDRRTASINAETVEALLHAVRDFLTDEDRREQSINARAGGLAGFVGIIVSLVAAGGQAAVAQRPSPVVAALGGVAFTLTIGALLTSLGIAVTRILIPQEGAAISAGAIERYPTSEYVTADKATVQGELLRGLVTALGEDRQRNSTKARALRQAYAALLVGVLSVAGFGVILGVDAL